ncbi:SH2D5 protein, partial [Edolisoma coerulescens]|nr:SH2D5 protein [Edolisoma coerulescens]
QYVGSFMVEELELQQRAGQLEEQLRALKVGIYHCSPLWETQGTPNNRGTHSGHSPDPPTLLMAHALRRILYSTWRLPDRQFAFVARNPH